MFTTYVLTLLIAFFVPMFAGMLAIFSVVSLALPFDFPALLSIVAEPLAWANYFLDIDFFLVCMVFVLTADAAIYGVEVSFWVGKKLRIIA